MMFKCYSCGAPAEHSPPDGDVKYIKAVDTGDERDSFVAGGVRAAFTSPAVPEVSPGSGTPREGRSRSPSVQRGSAAGGPSSG